MVMADGPTIVCFCFCSFFSLFSLQCIGCMALVYSGSEVMADGHTIVVSEGHRSSSVHQGGQN